MQVTEDVLQLSIPGQTMGETVGISKNSKGHLFVYSRTGPGGVARGRTAAMLFEFDQNLKFVKVWGPNNYAASFAHSVRVDKYDNVWMVDEGSRMIVKFDPEGKPQMQFGRTPEAIDYLQESLERSEKVTNRHPKGQIGTFNRETDVTWDSQDNIYGTDGYGNSRIVKMTKGGHWLKTLGRSAMARISSTFRHRGRQARQSLRGRPQQPPHPGLRHGAELQENVHRHGSAVEFASRPGRRNICSAATGRRAGFTRWT